MKRKIIRGLFTSTLIILLLFSSLFFATSCRTGAGTIAWKIEQTALYRGKELQINMRVFAFPSISMPIKKFYSKATFTDIKKVILKKYSAAEISEENHSLFIKLPYENSSQKAYFLLQKFTRTTDKGEYIYEINIMNSTIAKDGYHYFSVLMPLYMFPYNEDRMYGISLDKDQEYEILNDYDLEDIYHFYEDSGYFQIKKTDTSIILEKLIWDEDTPIPDYCVLPSPITISYRAENDKHYIAYSVEKNKDE